jgi:hypothetical protein
MEAYLLDYNGMKLEQAVNLKHSIYYKGEERVGKTT